MVIGLVVVVICSVVVVWSFDGLEAVVSVFFSVCFAVVAASDTVVWLETSLAASSGGSTGPPPR